MLNLKSTGYIQTLEISVFRVCVSHTELDWHWNSRHSKSQHNLLAISTTARFANAFFCLEIKKFKLFLWVLKSKYLQHFIALNTCGLWLNLHPSYCCAEDNILTLLRLRLGDGAGYRAISPSLKKYQGTRMLFLSFKWMQNWFTGTWPTQFQVSA